MTPETLARVALYCFFCSATLLAGAVLLGWLSLVGRTAGAQFTLASPSSGRTGTPRPRTEALLSLAERWTVAASFGALTLSLAARAFAAGRPPLGSQYEFAIAFAWGVLAVYLTLGRRLNPPGMSPAVLAVTLALLLYASTLPSAVVPPVPALQNPLLLGLHVGAAVVAYGANGVAFAAAVLFLAQRWLQRREGRVSRLLPDPHALDELGYRAVMVSFPMLAVVLLLGSWWGSIAWGTYWSWDPKESATLATWFVYGAYLHMRVQREWQGTAGALLLVAGFALTIFTYAGNLFFDSLHSYSGIK